MREVTTRTRLVRAVTVMGFLGLAVCDKRSSSDVVTAPIVDYTLSGTLTRTLTSHSNRYVEEGI